MDRETIELLTLAVRLFRQLKAMGIYDMPIKWNITAKATKARGLMDQISAEYDGFNEIGTEHLADVKGLRGQIGDMKDDLYAAANVMGNGLPAGRGGSGEEKSPAGDKSTDGQKNASTVTVTAEEVGKIPAETFQR